MRLTECSYVLFFRQVVTWHRPFCVDLQEGTFSLLRSFLETYCSGFNQDSCPPPFPTFG